MFFSQIEIIAQIWLKIVNICRNLQPDSGNPFLLLLKFNLNLNRLQKRLGTEGGNSCQN